MTQNKAPLLALFREKYEARFNDGDFPLAEWTDADDAELGRLQSGDVGDLDQAPLMMDAFAQEEESLTTRLKNLPKARLNRVLEALNAVVENVAPTMQNDNGD